MRTEPPPAARPPEEGGLDMPREGEGLENRGTLNEGERPMLDEPDGVRSVEGAFPPEKFLRNWLITPPVRVPRFMGVMLPRGEAARGWATVPWLRLG